MALEPSPTLVTESRLVVVTRPEREARAWAEALQSRGVLCDTLPLIEIAALPDASLLGLHWQTVSTHLAVMFVSANAVRFFMAARPAGVALANCRAWSTGPGTHAALLAAGWPAESIDSPPEMATQFDSEALWALVAKQTQGAVDWAAANASPQPTVLIVRGADTQGQLAGRDWLALQLEGVGVQVLQTVAYVRRAPALTAQQRALSQQATQDGSWWLFSSSEAAQHLLQVCPDLPIGQARALATHPRIAQRLRNAGWGRVEIVPAGLEAQAESIKSLA